MAEKPPYTSVNDVDAFFERIQTLAEPKPPKKVDTKWVKDFGFDTGHPSAIPSMLRWLRIISDDGESLGVWDDLRVDSSRAAALSELVKVAYAPLLEAVVVENATASDLRGGFVSTYGIGDPRRHIKCFLALCRHADMPTAIESKPGKARKATPGSSPKPQGTSPAKKPGTKGTGAGKVNATKGVPSGLRQEAESNLARGVDVRLSLNVEIPADWTSEQVRSRVMAITELLARSDP